MKNNMYDFISKTVNPLAGRCSHNCSYCYVKKMKKRNLHAIISKYSGEPRISDAGIKQMGGQNKLIFVSSMTDLFAEDVKEGDIIYILTRCNYKNRYLFQTKNPGRLLEVRKSAIKGSLFQLVDFIPENSIIITTIETNIHYGNYMGNTPHPEFRAKWMGLIDKHEFEKQITIEPIMDFHLDEFVNLLKEADVKQINIGADSGNNNLPEPSKEKIIKLIKEIEKFTIVNKKDNLKRLLH